MEREVLAGGYVDIVVVLLEDLFEAIEGGLDGAVAGPVDADAVFDEEYIFFLCEEGEGLLVDFFVDVDIEVKGRVIQNFYEAFQLLRMLMRQDQVCNSHPLLAFISRMVGLRENLSHT